MASADSAAAAAKTEEQKLAEQRAEYQKLLELRSQGVYLPPHKLRALQAAITDPKTKEYQRIAWDALKKSINGLVNKVNTANIKHVVPELFNENLIRGRGLFCQSLLKAQHASLPFTPIYACMAAIVNTKLPQVGELLVKRLIMRFRKAFKRNDKPVCLSSTMFIAHLVNQQVVHETLAGQILVLLLQKPTDDSVEIAVGFMREVGLFLEEMAPRIAHIVFDQFKNILHEADIDRRTQYMIEVLFQIRKDRYKDNPVIKEELDLIEEEDQITHRISLDEDINTEDSLNIFKYDPEWEENENEYKKLKAEILGEVSGDEDEEDEDEEDEESEESEDEEQKAIEIRDQTNADLVNLRRTIYLTIQSSADPEEAAHKLMKLKLPPGQEPELVSMIIESCAQEKVYSKFMGLLGEKFARLNRMWMELYEEAFTKYYNTIHRYETNKLRNIARFFGHLLSYDAIGWHVLSVIQLTEEETTAASRIFIRFLFEDIQENLGTAKLKARLGDEALQPYLEGIFRHDTRRNVTFAINYFTAIKMGYLTDEMHPGRHHGRGLGPEVALRRVPLFVGPDPTAGAGAGAGTGAAGATPAAPAGAEAAPEIIPALFPQEVGADPSLARFLAHHPLVVKQESLTGAVSGSKEAEKVEVEVEVEVKVEDTAEARRAVQQVSVAVKVPIEVCVPP
ncbi:putative pre-mRNA splicing protein [Thermochaetoides thermophila DSM 1495]|uniref:Pre-mRNA-splicing factor CWC22 n=1 Tax=Chaetomium thermophilum (strain DSM 1495 / CBS 144.50 / IMI 039719) TaxID=759272 RepID=G0S5W9_CHATD|nr:putative pre-mRNA splicing protein [Thermochaetoides thermophila DSM 1495]EGS20685.1 putative pre-mRNA splicing protein [Thermochaetoides thermophila DSM 1495]